MTQNREEWLRERKTYIGGSDIAAIMGLSTFRTAVDIYLDKITPEVINEKKDEDIAKAAHWGTLLEEIIASEYSKVKGVSVRVQDGPIRHPRFNFLAANIDRWADDGKYILECKTAHFMKKHEWEEETTDQIPEGYLVQAAYYSAICNVPKVDIAVLIGGQDFRIYTYEKDEEFENKLIKLAYNFWNEYVVPRKSPPAKTLYDAGILYPTSNGTRVIADTEIIDKVMHLKQLKMQEDVLSEEIKQVQLSIKNYMQDNEILTDTGDNALVTWKSSKPRKVFDAAELKKEHEEIYIRYVKEINPVRPFIIKI